ncbi:manganese-dependent ADP-ribose/CDP-alcohol diphosphatase [Electrophorus electricus]|uniref:Manganese-dependent ADP-ribose/CDP-alcohol diphosphatase n=1 Tax=Electrophorus electricus TaxID=8005 RepID=A0A4W4EU12_ELEEL|nr:manganese-dependent ADP-ribose/CDP-alcohol diphosphatase [Electrophorus electricus]
MGQFHTSAHSVKHATQDGVQLEDGADPLFTFGVIADIQYADLDDGFNFHGTRKRYYRSSLRLLCNANRRWAAERVRPSFVLQLGDVIDGSNRRHGASQRALRAVMDEFGNYAPAVHHVWGNHEFYNFSRSELLSSALNSGAGGDRAGDGVHAYHFSPAPGFRFVVLDAYDLSVIGRERRSDKYELAFKLIKAHNPNRNLNEPPGYRHWIGRFVQFNGGFSQEQLDWLHGVLLGADEKKEKVVVVSHIPVHPLSTDGICLAWNYDKVLSILNSHKSVVCFMAGHDHDGGYYLDTSGIHHLTLEGVIETPPDSDAFGTVYVYEDKMVLKGNGRISDRLLMY